MLTTKQKRHELTIRVVLLLQWTTSRTCSPWASDGLLDVALDDFLELVEPLEPRRFRRAAGQECGQRACEEARGSERRGRSWRRPGSVTEPVEGTR